MKEQLEELLKELNCIAYHYDNSNNLIHINNFFSDEHLLYKELVLISSKLDYLTIKYKIDLNNNIQLI